MKFLKFLLLGILFGIIMTKAEIISWFRIYEMFRFESFHMYGIIGSAILLGVFYVQIIKRFNIKSIDGLDVDFHPKAPGFIRYFLGGTLFGLGWAVTGACPGPMFVLLGNGFLTVFIMILGSVLGTFIYGVLRHKLPH